MARWDVYIQGQGYLLDGEYGDKAYSEDPIDVYVGAGGETPWQAWSMRSFHGGERQEFILSEDDAKNSQYYRAEGLRLDKFGQATLQPALERSLAVQSTSMPMAVTTDGARLIVGLSVSPYIKYWTSAGGWANATSVAGSGAVTDIVVIGSVLYAIRGGALITSADSGATWSALTYTPRIIASISVGSGGNGYVSAPTVVIESETGTGATATASVANGKVTLITVNVGGSRYDDNPTIRLEGGGGSGASAYAVTGLGSPTAYSGAISLATVNQDLYVGFSTSGVFNHTDSRWVKIGGAATSMCGYQEDLYWIEDRRLWRYNGRAAFEFDTLPQGFNGTLLFPYRSALFIIGYYKEQGGYRNACYYLWQSSESHLCSWGDYNADNRSYAACGSDDEVWFSVAARGGADRYDFTYGGLTCAPAWGAAGLIPYKAMAYCDGYLFVGRYGNVAGTDGIYIADISSPSTYRVSGWLESSEYDFDFADDEKILHSVSVYHRPLATGESIDFYYSIDGGLTWIEHGASFVEGTTRMVWQFPNLRFETIRWKVILHGPGTSTPTMRRVTVRACAVANAKWEWKMHLALSKIASRSGRTRRGYAALAALKTAYEQQIPVSFVDRIGRMHTALVKECIIDSTAADRKSAYVYVELLEI